MPQAVQQRIATIQDRLAALRVQQLAERRLEV